MLCLCQSWPCRSWRSSTSSTVTHSSGPLPTSYPTGYFHTSRCALVNSPFAVLPLPAPLPPCLFSATCSSLSLLLPLPAPPSPCSSLSLPLPLPAPPSPRPLPLPAQGSKRLVVIDSLSKFYDYIEPSSLKLPESTAAYETDQQAMVRLSVHVCVCLCTLMGGLHYAMCVSLCSLPCVRLYVCTSVGVLPCVFN